MIRMDIDTAKITKLQAKFSKYGPYAIKQGLGAMSKELNSSSFKQSVYPPSQAGSPFIWSSERQRRYVFANVDLPYSRTMGLANSGTFKVDENSFWIEYSNSVSWWIYVLHPSYQIIGHKARGWKPINQYVVNESGKLVPIFKRAALDAWTEMDSFIMGSGGGL